GTAGDDAGTGGRRTQIDPARAVTAGDVVMQRAAFAQCNPRQVPLGRFGRLADRLRHLARLAMAEPDPALLVADHDQRGKAEALAALDDFRHAIDMDELVDELAVALLALPVPFASAAFAFTCHGVFQSLRGRSASVLSRLESTFEHDLSRKTGIHFSGSCSTFEHDLFRKTGAHFSGSCSTFEHDLFRKTGVHFSGSCSRSSNR